MNNEIEQDSYKKIHAEMLEWVAKYGDTRPFPSEFNERIRALVMQECRELLGV